MGSAHNYEVSFNPPKITEALNGGMNVNSLHKGVAIHEIGHNIGGEHEDGTSVMENVMTHPRKALDGTITNSYTYPSMSDNFTKKIFSKRDTPRPSGVGRIWTKKR